MNWDDLRFLLALSREGTLTRAARTLRTDATTVRRRVDRLEADLDAVLVLRSGEGWRLTQAGEQAALAGARAEAAVAELRRQTRGSASEVQGRVRLTTVEVLATRLIVPHLRRLRAQHPALSVDLLCTNRTLDLNRGEADVALRMVRPTSGSLRVRRLAEVRERPYVARRLLDRLGFSPKEVRSLDALDVVLMMGTGDHRWTLGLGEAHVAARSTSASAHYVAVQAGLGVGMLADVMAREDPELVPLPGLEVERSRPLWLLCPEELAEVARVRAVMDFVTELVGQIREA
ncbi:MAG: LysR family transcriptional regulator [Alphaproteobacteria bacterium]|nr:LysR family transcriptional regulator [Alphaproteobacteria bacterium]